MSLTTKDFIDLGLVLDANRTSDNLTCFLSSKEEDTFRVDWHKRTDVVLIQTPNYKRRKFIGYTVNKNAIIKSKEELKVLIHE